MIKTSGNYNSKSPERSVPCIILTSGFLLVDEGLAQDVPRGFVKLLQVELPAIRLQVFQDLLHCAEFRHGFTQNLHAVQSHGHDGGHGWLLRQSDRKQPGSGLFTKHVLQKECVHFQIFWIKYHISSTRTLKN